MRRDENEAARDEALAQIQSQNITAETKSDDPYVRRARPTFPLCDHRCDGLFPHRRARHQRLPAQGLGADADSRLLPRTIRVCLPRLYRGEDLGKDEGTRLTWRAYGDVYLGQRYAVSEDSSVDCLWEGLFSPAIEESI